MYSCSNQWVLFIIFSTRIFSRILVIPFEEITLGDTLVERMNLKQSLEAKMEQSINSCGVFLKLHNIFDGLIEDEVSKDIEEIIPKEMDSRSQENYFLLIFTVCKV